MSLEVRLLSDTAALTTISVDADASSTVADVALRLATATSHALPGIRLCFRGKLLADGAQTLASAGVTSQHFIVALVQPASALRLSWLPATGGEVPPGAVCAGYESNGTLLFVARLSQGGGAHPGKLASPLGGCRAGYGGQEICSETYQALVARDAHGRPWPNYHVLPNGKGASSLPLSEPRAHGLPDGALVAGYEGDGTRLYSAVGTDPNGGMCPGKVQQAWTACSAGWGGAERQLAPWRALCVPLGVTPPRDDSAPPAPAKRIRRYLNSIDELLAWTVDSLPEDVEPPPADAATAGSTVKPLPSGRPRVLACHDMQGGYCRAADETYLETFAGWSSVDAFVYFAHHRVCVPPRAWIEACHARGVPCLGTLITEGAGGVHENITLLSRGDEAAERLAMVASAYGFDGWLINVESPVPAASVPSLVELLQLLTICCKQAVGDHALVIYYDSLDATTGRVAYQNGLTPANACFFEACDGIFTNYWWRSAHLADTAALAGERRHDVFVGVDCFARGDLNYSAGPGCANAVATVRDAGLSVALFAPGWSLECGEAKWCENDTAAAHDCDARFWRALGVERLFRGQ